MVSVGLVFCVVASIHLTAKLLTRPQRGVLVLAAVAPFDGLLLLLDWPDVVNGWKELLVAATLAATFVGPARKRPPVPTPIPAWVAPLAGLVALGLISVLWTPAPFALAGLKVDFYYLLLAYAIWRCPLDAGDRDNLVTILMVGGVVTSLVGIAQQLLGVDVLNSLGYEFNTVIRTAGDSVLRSFSTFELPFPFAFYVVLVLAVAVPVALADPTRLRNRLFLIATPILIAGMVTAVVRAAILAVVVAGAYHVARRYRSVLSLAPTALLAVVVAPAVIWSAALSAQSLDDRVAGWTIVSDSVVSEPWGTGIGTTGAAAGVGVAAYPDDDLGLERSESFGLPPDLVPYQPDNYYVKRLLELGLAGLWLTILMLRHVIGSARSVRARAKGADVALIDGILASIVGAVVAAVVATYWEIFPLDLYFWMMLGVLTSIDRAESRSVGSPSAPAAGASRPTSVSY